MPSKPSSNLRISLGGILLLVLLWTCMWLTSCASVPDVPVCVEINQAKGFCTNTISDTDYEIDEQHPAKLPGDDKPKTWWERRPFMILVPTSSWAELKAYIIKQCKRSNCDQYVKSWDRKISELEEKAPQ